MWRHGSTFVQPVDVFWSYRVTVSAGTAAGLLLWLARRSGTLSDNLRDPDLTTDNFKHLLKKVLLSAYQCNYRIRRVTTMRSTNLHFTYLLTIDRRHTFKVTEGLLGAVLSRMTLSRAHTSIKTADVENCYYSPLPWTVSTGAKNAFISLYLQGLVTFCF